MSKISPRTGEASKKSPVMMIQHVANQNEHWRRKEEFTSLPQT
jgi:hypothetical protein